MLKRVLKDREFNSSDEIEEAILKIGGGPTFDEVQSLFHNRMIHLVSVLENGESVLLKKYKMVSSHVVNLKICGVGKSLLHSVFPIPIGNANMDIPPKPRISSPSSVVSRWRYVGGRWVSVC
jgi:hypothetical protein